VQQDGLLDVVVGVDVGGLLRLQTVVDREEHLPELGAFRTLLAALAAALVLSGDRVLKVLAELLQHAEHQLKPENY